MSLMTKTPTTSSDHTFLREIPRMTKRTPNNEVQSYDKNFKFKS